jgi:PAS domain S-box-containing protein
MHSPARVRTRFVNALEGLTSHQHVCLVYDSQEEQLATVIPFLRIGLERGERCLYVMDENSASAVAAALSAEGVDVDSKLRSGALVLATKREAYLKEGRFDPDWMIGFLKESVEAALAAGFSALRVTAEMSWQLAGDPGAERLLEYEAKVNDFFHENKCLGVCQYNRRRFSAELLAGVIHTHPVVIWEGTVCRNSHYVPPREFLEPGQSAREVERLLCTIRDGQQVEDALREQQNLLKTMLAAMPEMLVLKDRNLVYQAANPAFCQVVGRREEEVVGKTAFDLFARSFAELSQRGDLEAVQTRRPQVEEGPGPEPGCGKWFYVVRIPVIDPTGEVTGLVWSARDITEQKRAEEASRRARDELELRVQERTAELEQSNRALQAEIAQRNGALDAAWSSEERYRHLFDSANDIVFTLDLQGNVISLNKAAERITGYSPSEKGVWNLAKLATPECQELPWEMLRAKLGGAECTTYALTVLTKDGRRVHLEVSTRLQFREGKAVGVQGIARDITERRQAEEVLRQNEAVLHHNREALRTLTAGLLTAQEQEWKRLSRELHDDLNQKLAMLAVEVEALEQELPVFQIPIRDRLGSLKGRLIELSDDVRRMAYQLHPSILEHLGLAVALRSYCAEYSERERIKARFVHRDLPEALPQDVALCLYRVAQEGLRNVAKHSGSSRVTVSLAGVQQGVRLSITDFGAGFDPESVKSKGGLGLISMQERVRMMQGSITVASQPGRGTRIEVRIPLPGGEGA